MTTEPSAMSRTSSSAGGDQDERSIARCDVPEFRCDNRRWMYRELPPPRDLAHSLACVWTSVARGGRILPDGCADIVWDGAELVVAGPATSALERAPAPGTPVFGVR